MLRSFCLTLIFSFIFLSFSNVAFADGVNQIKILIVPGHDKTSWGAQYGFLKEADMNLALATLIYQSLKQDGRFEVHITRNSKGYTKEFAELFALHKESVAGFIQSAKKNMRVDVLSGLFVEKANTPHGLANEDMVTRLYGFNKWANENKMDAVVHVHFNDYGRKNKWKMGDRHGFAIYVPDEQFVNSEDSLKLGDSIFTELKKKYKTSNYVNELGGMVSDQELIALGANRTLISSVSSVLVEYGYIYKFGNSGVRHRAYNDMSKLTVVGIKNYFKVN